MAGLYRIDNTFTRDVTCPQPQDTGTVEIKFKVTYHEIPADDFYKKSDPAAVVNAIVQDCVIPAVGENITGEKAIAVIAQHDWAYQKIRTAYLDATRGTEKRPPVHVGNSSTSGAPSVGEPGETA